MEVSRRIFLSFAGVLASSLLFILPARFLFKEKRATRAEFNQLVVRAMEKASQWEDHPCDAEGTDFFGTLARGMARIDNTARKEGVEPASVGEEDNWTFGPRATRQFRQLERKLGLSSQAA
jgi:hypothetical protein